MSGGSPTSSRSARPSPAVIRRRRLIVGLIAVLAIALVAVLATISVRAFSGGGPKAEAAGTASTPTPKPTSTPLTPAQQLLKTAADPATACAVSFAGEGITQPPMLQTEEIGRAHV